MIKAIKIALIALILAIIGFSVWFFFFLGGDKEEVLNVANTNDELVPTMAVPAPGFENVNEAVVIDEDGLPLADDEMDSEGEEQPIIEVEELLYPYQAELTDVTGGTASGTAEATYDAGAYMLRATFTDLPDPEEGFFYEGWVVRPGDDLSIISTGELINVDGLWTNKFTSTDDLTDHTQYVLTIEPDDGDPAPADHVLEGDFEMVR